MRRADWIDKEMMGHLLAALTPANRLVMEVCMATGLRLGDVLEMRTDMLRARKNRKLTVRQQKTGKNRRVTIPLSLYDQMLSQAGRLYVFEGRNDYRKHRTRQAVWNDLHRIAVMYRLAGDLKTAKRALVSPHTARKIYAVEQYEKSGGDMAKVQELLSHGDASVTALYALADALTARRLGKKKVS